jgi:outer membrane biogenesis lipoprotein LolB
MKFSGHFSCLLLAVFLSACSLSTMSLSASSPAMDAETVAGEAFALEARFSLTYPGEKMEAPKQVSGRLSWRHQADRDEWLFADPFGRGIARLTRQPDGRFTLFDGKQEFVEDSPQALEARIGFPLPLAELVDWVRARPGQDAIVEYDAAERPWRARKSGWLLVYRYAEEANRLPSQLEASLEQFRLKLVIKSWEMP